MLAPVHAIDEVHQILRNTVARRRGEITRALITPGVIQGYSDRHQFDMRESVVFDVRDQIVDDLIVFLKAPKRRCQDPRWTSDQNRLVMAGFFPVLTVCLVMPGISVDKDRLRTRGRTLFRERRRGRLCRSRVRPWCESHICKSPIHDYREPDPIGILKVRFQRVSSPRNR